MPGSSRTARTRLTAFDRLTGIRVTASTGGRAEAILRVGPRHRNRRGVVHGGAVSTLLDTALGAAVISSMTPEEWCATMTLTINFVGGATRGTLHASGRVVKRGKRVAYASGECVDDAGETLATATGVWYVWPSRPSPRPAAAGRP